MADYTDPVSLFNRFSAPLNSDWRKKRLNSIQIKSLPGGLLNMSTLKFQSFNLKKVLGPNGIATRIVTDLSTVFSIKFQYYAMFKLRF